MSYKEIEIENVLLRCYEDGTIERFFEENNSRYPKGWNVLKGCIANTGYKVTNLNYKTTLLHRIIASAYLGLDIKNKDIQIDHVNGNRQDNRVCNLRLVSHTQNQWNHLDVKGYCKTRNKFVAKITVNKSIIRLGTFETEKEAREAYLEAKKIYHKI